MASATHELIFKNDSTEFGTVCIYQTDPAMEDPNLMSLAWLCKATAPTTQATFEWTIDYSFVWSETGPLAPGVMCHATQIWDADLETTNQVDLTRIHKAYTFENQTAGPQHGTLYIDQDRNIVLHEVAVGIGMSGSGTMVVQGQPNIIESFTPHPQYWITFGNYRQGEVLDTTQITNAAKIDFPPNVYSMTATLNHDHTWTVSPT